MGTHVRSIFQHANFRILYFYYEYNLLPSKISNILNSFADALHAKFSAQSRTFCVTCLV